MPLDINFNDPGLEIQWTTEKGPWYKTRPATANKHKETINVYDLDTLTNGANYAEEKLVNLLNKGIIHVRYSNILTTQDIKNTNNENIKFSRLDLISDSSEEEPVVTKEIQNIDLDEDNLTEADTDSLEKAIVFHKDRLYVKSKQLAQANQAKKEAAAGYRESINILKEELEKEIETIDKLQQQFKLKQMG